MVTSVSGRIGVRVLQRAVEEYRYVTEAVPILLRLMVAETALGPGWRPGNVN